MNQKAIIAILGVVAAILIGTTIYFAKINTCNQPVSATPQTNNQPYTVNLEQVDVRGSTKILTVNNFEKIRNYLYSVDKNSSRKRAIVAGFQIENFGTANPFDRFSITGQYEGKNYDFMFVIEDKNTLNIFSQNTSEDLMTKDEIKAAENMTTAILGEIDKLIDG